MEEVLINGRSSVNIYLFNPETGAFLGKDFVDEELMGLGAFMAPSDATQIVPPSVKHGQLLVFNSAGQRWYIRRRPENKGK